MSAVDWDSLTYFTEAELRCKCGCGRADMDPTFMAELDDLRRRFSAPIIVTSGYRCPDHNERVSSTGRDGPHTTGKAVDVSVMGEDAHELLDIALERGFSGIGVKQNGPHSGRFLHLDMLNSSEAPRPWVWSY